MRRSLFSTLVVCAACAFAATAQAPPALTVLRGGPTGELGELDQANEIRIVFSEPMVALGRIPPRVEAPFVRIEPAVNGTFRWSGTTILIFTPDPGQPLPYATSFKVSIDRTAGAVSGRQLASPYTFTFTTPAMRLLALKSGRVQNRFDRPVLLYLRFNQPVDPQAVLSHVQVRLSPYDWAPPRIAPAAEARLSKLDPAGLQQFRAKVAAVTAATRASTAVPVRVASSWDVKRFPPADDLVVLETTTAPPPQTRLQVTLDRTLPSPQGSATPSREQQLVETLAPALFVVGLRCESECEPSSWNGIELTSSVPIAAMRAATSVTNIGGARDVPLAPGSRPSPRDPASRNASAAFLDWDVPSSTFTLEDLGYPAQPPVSRYAIRVAPTLEAEDGQRLGYPWIGIVANWRHGWGYPT
jgi:hypothetical protein